MTGRALIDSNVLVSALDPSNPDKPRRAADTLDGLEPTGRGVLSTQARLNQLDLLLSEDFQDGRVIDGVRVLNPFAPSFDLAGLLR